MKLSKEQFRLLHSALLAAFPSRNALERMVRFGLDQNLAAIAGGDTASDVVFNLVSWAEAYGRVPELIAAARGENPGNPQLAEAERQILAMLQPATDQEPGAAERGVSVGVLRELLDAALSDGELTTLCFDHYPRVHGDFAAGMTKSQKLTLLLEHCVKNGRLEELAGHVERLNPYQYGRFEQRLRQA